MLTKKYKFLDDFDEEKFDKEYFCTMCFDVAATVMTMIIDFMHHM